MRIDLKKRGQNLAKKITRFSKKASKEGKEHIKENLVERIEHVRNVRLLILEWSLLVGAVILLALTQSVWYANSYSSRVFVAGGTYTEATLGKINSLNPLFASTNSEKALARLMFATLATSDYSGHTGPGLAESITADDAGKVWKVRLREDLKWSDGEPITNEDVVFTVNLIKNPKVTTVYSSNFSGVTVAIDGGVLVFTLPVAYVNFPSALNFPVLPEHILKDVEPSVLVEHNFSVNPVTSGAFKYNATQMMSQAGEMVVYLSPNANYYRGKPMLNSFAVHAYTSIEDIIAALKGGSVTATAELSTLDAENVTSAVIFERQTAIANGVYLFLNTGSEMMRNKTLRQAIQRGLDMSAIREKLGGEAGLDYPILKSQISLAEWPKVAEYDQSAAADLVAASGVTEDQTINLVTVSTGYFKEIAENVKEQLAEIGITVEVTMYEPTQDFVMNVISPRAYDILLYEVELGSDPDLFAYYHSSQAGSAGLNLSNYRNSLADDAILAARGAMNVTLRTTKYKNFLTQWVEDVPAIGIYQSNLVYYYNRNVRAFSEDNHLIYKMDRFVDIEHWAAEQDTRQRTP